ncbi:BREX-1 system adenine-specific DNA-methyltransferase PglX [Tsukamurella spumae]|uniref:site-specific DNA-methyltransferase (adenine-specific) n=1 Tax=Tsukamurella spumae TaxID=44753 RepID=A0A846WV13_9ACTN|nr:BREX-1 system adenine-specific DNA-methyltransferase PglX [Tsukamurella spumae]NKY16938.1 BREX-1 system adenine-specific DNA-methyltransferase PglX [Tsukamurella spumae]
MDSSKLEKFATAARVTLLDQMAGLVTQALNDPKIAAEYPNDVIGLRAAVSEHGETWVADTAAHTWFNRLTAARFMDVRGFSGPYRVVSPAADSASNLPEILLRAQSGEFGDEISERTRSEVSALLSGRRTSVNPELEAYALLLRAMFVAWYPSMPEVFTGPADWIRLLVPADLLAPTSVRERAVAVMDDDACATVEVVGWLYQFYNSDLKDEINKAKVPIDAAELPAVTQLFTPHWIVRYLVENSLGRLWLRSRPNSALREHMPYFVEPIEGQPDTGITVESPEEIRLVDPACGSGHMLTYAFDLLFHIYEEAGYARTEIPRKILANNLRGLEIDSRAAQLASFALAMKAREKDRRFLTRKTDDGAPVRPDIVRIEPLAFDGDDVDLLTQGLDRDDRTALESLLQSFVHADTFGSLIRVDPVGMAVLRRILTDAEQSDGADTTVEARREVLTRVRRLYRQANALEDDQYHVVVANPPYLGSGNMGGMLKGFAKKHFSAAKSDLYAMFMQRNSGIMTRGGSVAMLTMHSWMFLPSFKLVRAWLEATLHVNSAAHLGANAFDTIDGEVVQVVAFVMDGGPRSDFHGKYFRLVDYGSEVEKSQAFLEAVDGASSIEYECSPIMLNSIPDRPIIYWMPPAMIDTFDMNEPLSSVLSTREGLTTGDNDSFVRRWHEVSSVHFSRPEENLPGRDEWRKRWYPYQKGGAFRRWYGNHSFLVDWQGDGVRAKLNVTESGRIRSHNYNGEYAFKCGLTWSDIASGSLAVRMVPGGFMFDATGPMGFPGNPGHAKQLLGLLNSTVASSIAGALASTLHFKLGHILAIPTPSDAVESSDVAGWVDELIRIFRYDWDLYERSWDYRGSVLVQYDSGTNLDELANLRWLKSLASARDARDLEIRINSHFVDLYQLGKVLEVDVPREHVALTGNPYFRYVSNKDVVRSDGEYRTLFDQDLARELLSYAVGCIMGRYSLDKPGLILADAGATIADFETKVPNAQFRPDEDGIVPITATAYFEDDIVSRVHEFLSIAFGAENLTANVSWIEHALGSGKRKDLRQYFLKDFYNDHLKMYSNRPIYWQVASNSKQPSKGFNALIYLHRYTPATLGILRENYANDMLDKQEARLTTIEHALDTADKAEATKLRKERDALTEMRRDLQDWVTTTLFPLSTAEIALDLDDGVKQNYPKLGAVLKSVKGLS